MTEWTEDDTAVFLEYGGRFVPDRESQYRIISWLVGDAPPGVVVDLCGGSGELIARLLQDHPEHSGLELDASTRMLESSVERMRPLGRRFRAQTFDLPDQSWRTLTSVSAFVSSLAVHHLDGAEKKGLFADLYRMLVPGGRFVLADLFLPVEVRAHELARREWDAFVRASDPNPEGTGAYRAFHDLAWNCFEYPDDLDKPSTVSEQMAWLGEAGFVDVDVYWMNAGHVILGGRREVDHV